MGSTMLVSLRVIHQNLGLLPNMSAVRTAHWHAAFT